MGFSVYYEATEPVDADRLPAVLKAAKQFSAQYSWFSCEPLYFHKSSDGKLSGSCKPRIFDFNEGDYESSLIEGLPDGTLQTLLDGLSEISRQFDIAWEINADHFPRPIGFIRNGKCDPKVAGIAATLVQTGQMLFEEQGFQSRPSRRLPASDQLGDDDEEEFPPTIRLWREPE